MKFVGIISVIYIWILEMHVSCILRFSENSELYTGKSVFKISRIIYYNKGRRSLDSMVVGFTTIYAICAYHHWRSSYPEQGEVYNIMW